MNIKPAALASSFTIAVISLCCCADNAFIGFFVIAGCAEILLAGFAIGVLLSCVLLLVTRQSTLRRVPQIVVASVLCLMGIFALWMGTNTQPALCAAIGGMLLGLGSIGMMGQWAWFYARIEHDAIISNIALILLCTSIIWCLLRLMNGFVPICLAMALCTVCAGVVAIIGSIATRDNDLAAEEQRAHQDANDRSEVHAALTSFESFVFESSSHMSRWHAFESGCALVLGFFVIGAEYWPNAMEMELPAAFTKPLCYFVACVVAVIVGKFARSVSYKGHDERQPMRVVLAIAALLILGGAFLSSAWGDAARPIVHMADLIAFALLNVYGISYTFTDILASGISPARSCVVVVCLCYVGMAFGILTYLIFGNTVFMVVSILAIAYVILVAIIAIQAVHGGRTSKNYQRRIQ